MTGEATDHDLRPVVDADWPAGRRPMIADVRSLPGHERQLRTAVTELMAAVRREPGCITFDAFEWYEQPGRFHLHEIYDDADAFKAHLDTPQVQRFFAALESHSTSTADDLTQLTQLA